MQIVSSFVSRGNFQVCVPFVVYHHIWVPPIYAANFVSTVLLYVDIYVGLMPHILAWRYQLCVFWQYHFSVMPQYKLYVQSSETG